MEQLEKVLGQHIQKKQVEVDLERRIINPAKLCDSILDYFEQNRAIFDVLDIQTPEKSELLRELEDYKSKLGSFIVNTTNMVWKALEENKEYF